MPKLGSSSTYRRQVIPTATPWLTPTPVQGATPYSSLAALGLSPTPYSVGGPGGDSGVGVRAPAGSSTPVSSAVPGAASRIANGLQTSLVTNDDPTKQVGGNTSPASSGMTTKDWIQLGLTGLGAASSIYGDYKQGQSNDAMNAENIREFNIKQAASDKAYGDTRGDLAAELERRRRSGVALNPLVAGLWQGRQS